MTILNVSTAGIIFSLKLFDLMGGVVVLYFLIKLILVKPAVLMLFFILVFDCVSYCPIMWDCGATHPS